ncbi:uncharacterized protein H6S33_005151 [Morchella sextelata]|uniref:uncharacterized protein n=1 Tax=Morchella sextelata TaxID=1174677 RepID=UPI001D0419DA|nr:uncharacterized protein H6S33_005151 [Morchella sextelata]KAH0605169.1 hypothetical protein H6S33_005151 [Morchella sextelata]
MRLQAYFRTNCHMLGSFTHLPTQGLIADPYFLCLPDSLPRSREVAREGGSINTSQYNRVERWNEIFGAKRDLIDQAKSESLAITRRFHWTPKLPNEGSVKCFETKNRDPRSDIYPDTIINDPLFGPVLWRKIVQKNTIQIYYKRVSRHKDSIPT